MPFNLGALMPGAQTDMNAKIAQTLAGGQGASPSPADGQGQGSAPTTATQAAPGQTPSPTYAPDPQNASTIQQLLQLHQRDSLMNGLSYDLRRIGASFGTAQQQASSMAALGAPPQEDTLGALGKIEAITDAQTKQNEHAQFMAGADVMGQQILGLKPGQGAWLAQSGQLPEIIQSHFHAMEPTDAVKNYTQARELMKKQGLTDEQIDQIMPPEVLTLGPSADISQRQYIIEKMNAQRAGKTDFPDFETWKEQHKQTATEVEDAHKSAMALPGLKSQLGAMDQKADAILQDTPAIQRILGSTSKQAAASKIINWDGKGVDPTITYGGGMAPTLDADEIRAVSNIRQLHLSDYAANFKTAGANQRLSQAEAKRLGDAADQLTNFTGSIDDYTSRVTAVKTRIAHEVANAHGEARDLDNLPVEMRPKIDPSFIDGPNAVKGRPKWAVPVTVSSKEDLDRLEYGQAYRPTTGQYAGRILFKGLEKGFED